MIETVPTPDLVKDKNTLTVENSAKIFCNTLSSISTEQSPFAGAPFIIKIAEQYIKSDNQTKYFTSDEGFGASIYVDDGVAEPVIDLNIREGLISRLLRKRIAFRLGKEDPTNEEIFHFAVGHELGHLIQGIPEYESIEEYDLTDFTEVDINVLKWKLDRKNKHIRDNPEVLAAREYFRSIFKYDIEDEENKIPQDRANYSDKEYLEYVNSQTETNADFIALWIMGMNNPDMITSPQNQGYHLEDWQKWAHDHQIDASHLM